MYGKAAPPPGAYEALNACVAYEAVPVKAPVNPVEQTVHAEVLVHLLQFAFTSAVQEEHTTLIFPEAPELT